MYLVCSIAGKKYVHRNVTEDRGKKEAERKKKHIFKTNRQNTHDQKYYLVN
jgi:hypothetical protein